MTKIVTKFVAAGYNGMFSSAVPLGVLNLQSSGGGGPDTITINELVYGNEVAENPTLFAAWETTGTVGAVTAYYAGIDSTDPAYPPDKDDILAGTGGGILETSTDSSVAEPSDDLTFDFTALSNTADVIGVIFTDGVTTSDPAFVTGVSLNGTAPAVSSINPADEAASVATGVNPEATFAENVYFDDASLTLQLYNTTDSTVIETFTPATTTTATGDNGGSITIVNNVMTIVPGAVLPNGKRVDVLSSVDAIINTDRVGFTFASGDWNFTTISTAGPTVANIDVSALLFDDSGLSASPVLVSQTWSAGTKVVAITYRTPAGTVAATGVTINGNAGTIRASGANNDWKTVIAEVVVPSSGTGDLVLNKGNSERIIGHVQVYDIASFGAIHDNNSHGKNSTGPFTLTIDVPNNGLLIGCAQTNQNLSWTWTGIAATNVVTVIENNDEGEFNYQEGMALEVGRTIEFAGDGVQQFRGGMSVISIS